MKSHHEHKFSPDGTTLTSHCNHGDCVSLSFTDYESHSVTILFQTRHIDVLEKVVGKLRKIRDGVEHA